MIQIDKNVPIPSSKLSDGRPAKYPWADMKPGDSFFVPHAVMNRAGKKGEIRFSVAHGYKRLPESSWTTRSVTENGVTGVRVWRVK